MLYTPSDSILIGNTVAFHLDVYDTGGAKKDAEDIDVRVVRGEHVIEGRIDTTVEKTGIGEYQYKFESGNYEPGEFVAVWRGSIVTDNGQKMRFVSQEKVVIERSELDE